MGSCRHRGMAVISGRASVRKEWQMSLNRMNSLALATGVSAVLLASLAAGCGGGGGGGSDPIVGARDLYVVDLDQDGLDGVSLNTPMQIEFSDFVLPATIRHDTIQVRLGPRYGI